MDPSYIPPCVYQFRVVVQGISPLIWRRLRIRSDMSLATLHAALQIVFAWSDEHLHAFRIHGKEYGCTRPGGPSFDVDPRQVPLATLHLHRGERFTYVYNFIDDWVCNLRLETILPLDPRRIYPVCTGGKRAAPPEDCGGAWAYLQRVDRHHVPLEAMTVVAQALDCLLAADDQTPIREVIGDAETLREAVDQLDTYLQFQPEHFDRRDVNAQLCALVQQEGT
jgi:Plasmid pRiA4b ORF-3-like protein